MTASSTVRDATGSDDNDPTLAISLQTPFFYQNRHTGQPSNTSLSTRQLCRILCASSSSCTSASSSSITQDSLLLGYDASSRMYDPMGWRCASSIPILQEACTAWYYETKDGEVKGPITTRALADILEHKKTSADNNDHDCSTIDITTRVFPSTQSSNDGFVLTPEWKCIQDLNYLRLAIEALKETQSIPTTWPDMQNNAINTLNISHMTYDEDNNIENIEHDVAQTKVQEELEAFLSSTDHLAPHAAIAITGEVNTMNENNNIHEVEEEYESDGGTNYVRDSRTGNWIPEALMPKNRKQIKEIKHTSVQSSLTSTNAHSTLENTKKRKKKAKFAAKNARNWIYVTGLPLDTNEEEVVKYFSKVGIIELDPETQKPKIKLYRNKDSVSKSEVDTAGNSGLLKGDASICYARSESVDLAMQILDENLFRDGAILSVQRAKFEQHGTTLLDNTEKMIGGGRRKVSEAKRKVARLAALQAVGWDEGENGRIGGGLKGLRIVVLMNIFDPMEFQHDTNDEKLQELERAVRTECEECGAVEKITVFTNNPAGVMIVKFSQAAASSEAVAKFNGKVWRNGRKVEASYWDGETDYTCHDVAKEEKETEKRLDEFGDWLENQDLPDEFQLKTEE